MIVKSIKGLKENEENNKDSPVSLPWGGESRVLDAIEGGVFEMQGGGQFVRIMCEKITTVNRLKSLSKIILHSDAVSKNMIYPFQKIITQIEWKSILMIKSNYFYFLVFIVSFIE